MNCSSFDARDARDTRDARDEPDKRENHINGWLDTGTQALRYTAGLHRKRN
jgi:hypothetical protein